MDVRKSFTGEERIRQATRADMVKHLTILSVITMVILLVAAYFYFSGLITKNLHYFLFTMGLILGVLLLINCIKFFFRYIILKCDYEFYFYSGRGKSGFVKGEQLGLPNKFCDLTRQEKEELDKGTYHPHRYQGPTNATGVNKIGLGVIIVYFYMFAFVIGCVVSFMLDYVDEMGHTSESYALAALGMMSIIPFLAPLVIVFIIVVKPYSKKVKKKYEYNPFADFDSKYYNGIEKQNEEEDPFSKYDK